MFGGVEIISQITCEFLQFQLRVFFSTSEVNIMSMAPMLPARVSNSTNQHTMFAAQCDTFLEMPALRWDVGVYYTDDPEGNLGAPKSYTKLDRGQVGSVELRGRR